MPSQREIDQNNALSRYRQQQRRDLTNYGFPAELEEQLESLKIKQSQIGSSYDTRQSRKIRRDIDALEDQKSTAINNLNVAVDYARDIIDQVNANPLLTIPSFEERERQAGLFLAGNDPSFMQNLLDNLPNTIEERERAAGLINTTTGRETTQQTADNVVTESETEEAFGSFPVTICIDGSPFSATIVGQIGGKLT